MGLVRSVILHVMSAGFLAGGIAMTADPFMQQACFGIAAGAFVLAWIAPARPPGARPLPDPDAGDG